MDEEDHINSLVHTVIDAANQLAAIAQGDDPHSIIDEEAGIASQAIDDLAELAKAFRKANEKVAA